MNKFAVIETGGKQYKVTTGQKIKVEKLNVKGATSSHIKPPGGSVSFDKVLLMVDGEKAEIGQPYLNHKVEARVLKEGRAKKKIIFRYHSKTRYRKKKGHMQPYTEVEIVRI